MSATPIRVVVIDDSAYNRQTIVGMLESDPGIRVVGRAFDGDEGLKQVLSLAPDVVTLDLEMPRMDGYTFLRILMSRKPTPVLVVSGWGARENVFKALELGALDFLVKPSRQISHELRTIRDELIDKVRLVTQLRMRPLQERARTGAPSMSPARADVEESVIAAAAIKGPAPATLVAIGASTGGPPALQQLIAALDAQLDIGLVITQHMPPKFTRAFASRLGRMSRFVVKEAESGDYITPGLALVAPGGGSLAVLRDGGSLRVVIEPGDDSARYVPSVDRMFETAADAMGEGLLSVVLTGMGVDGARGVQRVKERGGSVIAEAAETAVIFGMPSEAIATGVVDEVLPLGKIGEAIERFARRAGQR